MGRRVHRFPLRTSIYRRTRYAGCSSLASRSFFFSSRRRHTRFDCDWSSDVCSSDLRNLTAIVDYNHLQTDGTTEQVMDIGDVRAKFESFGWDSVEIDGHDMGAIVDRKSVV